MKKEATEENTAKKGTEFMKKDVSIVIAVILTLSLVIGAILASGYFMMTKNARILGKLMDEFSSTISEFAASDIIETKSVYGKLNGNGNGIQYFGIVLLHKDAIKDVDSLVSTLDEKFEAVEYCIQEESDISSKYLEHAKLKFDTYIDESSEYISICFFNSWHPDSNLWDPAGH